MVRNRAWPASSRLTVFTADGRVSTWAICPLFPRVRGRFFLVVHIYVFLCGTIPPGGIAAVCFSPTICDFGANCSPLQGQAIFFAAKNGVVLQKNTACYVRANINLSSPKRKERFRGKAGIDDRRRQTAHFRLDAAKSGSDIISCISPILATLCQIEATCTHRWNRRKNGRPMMAEPTAENVPEWDA